ncbi:MAG TPA: UDP-glucose 4-epimerase GalE [Bacteroidales bacterium]|nr:UDP-glucose 4-epimerase GalE [Bacteroidales bacterium]
MKILVTGGTGFIGAHTVVELQQYGYETIIIDNFSNSSPEVLDSIEKITGKKPDFEKVEMCDTSQLDGFFRRNRDIDGVIHFAAFKAVGESEKFPLKYYHNNVCSLINLLKSMQDYKINNLVFSSSCTVYGQPDILPVDENSPVRPAVSAYGETKQIAEKIITEQVRTTSQRSIILRYFNPIGAHESALIGELPVGVPNNLAPFITQTAIGKRECLNVWGNDYDTPDGTCIRDYIYVGDIAKAHVLALDRLLGRKTETDHEIFNLGTGRGNSVLEVIHSFERVSGQKLNYRFAPRRQGDIVKIWSDCTRANKILGWKAEKNLDEMMLSAWNWEKHLAENIKNT